MVVVGFTKVVSIEDCLLAIFYPTMLGITYRRPSASSRDIGISSSKLDGFSFFFACSIRKYMLFYFMRDEDYFDGCSETFGSGATKVNDY